jgi:predicted adenylyl cyclase CyaB
MYEVEIKFKVSNYKTIRNRLYKIGAKFVRKQKIIDENFTLKTRNFWKTVECLRIRSFNHEKTGILTYKPSGKKTRKLHTMKEINVQVSDKNALKEIFKYLGIVPLPYLSKLEKIRETYTLGKVVITIDKIRNFGVFLEIEQTTGSKREVSKLKTKLFSIADKLGLSEKEQLKEPVGFLILSKLRTKTV